MDPVSILIVAVIVVWFVAAVRHMWKNKGGCSCSKGSSGVSCSCHSCQSCGTCTTEGRCSGCVTVQTATVPRGVQVQNAPESRVLHARNRILMRFLCIAKRVAGHGVNSNADVKRKHSRRKNQLDKF